MRLAFATLALALAACSAPQSDPDLQNELSLLLKDPSSVQYQKITKNQQVICGELNSKNGYGAYTGFKVFVFERPKKELWLEQGDKANDHYQSFLNVMDKCENDVDLMIGVSGRTGQRIEESLRARTSS